MANDDGTLDVDAVLSLCAVVLRDSRHAYVFGGFVLPHPFTKAQASLVWDKVALGSGNLTSPWAPSHEPITFAAHGGKWAGKGGTLAARLRQGSVLTYPRPNGRGVCRHPTEKPVGLLRQLVESSSVTGEVALDPFVGSGSTAVACALEGRGCIGIEIDEGYAETAAKRCDVVMDWLDSAPSF